MNMIEYDEWISDPTPDRMATLVDTLQPTINSEVQRYTGPKPLLRARAKGLTIKAIRSYDPTRGAQLRSWVVTQLQPLSRYGQQLRPISAPEAAIRQAAEVHRVQGEMSDEMGRDPSDVELADKTGISGKRIQRLRKMVIPSVSEGAFEPNAERDATLPGTVLANKTDVAEDMVYDSLSPRDKAIYDMKTGKHGKSAIPNQLIAKRLGVTPALISQRSRQMAEPIADIQNRGLV
jgi:RNA polymerase primary sigma factor